MKKIIVSACLLCTGLFGKAQYFEMLYGTQQYTEILTDGHNAYNGGDIGHFLVGPGEWFYWQSPTYCFNAERTNVDGLTNLGAPYFSDQYYVTDLGYPTTPTYHHNLVVQEVKSHELTNSTASGFTLAGSYTIKNGQPSGANLFHVRLDPDGQVDYPTPSNNAAGYKLIGIDNAANLNVVSIKESTKTPNAVFICGNLRYPGNPNSQVFVLKVDETSGTGTYGNIIWAKIYDLDQVPGSDNSDFAAAMVESPYQNEVLVVGTQVTPGDQGNAFVMRIQDGNLSTDGTIVGNVSYHGTGTSVDGFSAIKASSNPAIDPLGENFVICGTTNKDAGFAADQDFWLVSIDDATGTEVWSNTFDYSDNTGSAQAEFNDCFDLIERYNTNTSKYEYYLAGTTYINGLAEIERMVVKADEFGRGYEQFLYPRFEADALIRIDQFNGYGADVDGLSLFGSVSYSNAIPSYTWDHNLVKTYFNGVTGCNLHDVHFTSWRTSPSVLPPTAGSSQVEFVKYEMLVGIYINPVDEFVECYETDVTGGMNLPRQQEGNNGFVSGDQAKESDQPLERSKLESISAYPNQLSNGNAILWVSIETETSQNAVLSILDVSGKVLYSEQAQLVEGENQRRVDLSDVHLESGTYYIKLESSTMHTSAAFVVMN